MSDGVVFWPRGAEANKRWSEFEALPSHEITDYVVRADVTGFYESIDHSVLQSTLVKLTGRVDVVEAAVGF